MNVSDIVKYCLDAFNSINFVSTVLYIIVNCRQRPLVSYDDVKLWNKKNRMLNCMFLYNCRQRPMMS